MRKLFWTIAVAAVLTVGIIGSQAVAAAPTNSVTCGTDAITVTAVGKATHIEFVAPSGASNITAPKPNETLTIPVTESGTFIVSIRDGKNQSMYEATCEYPA